MEYLLVVQQTDAAAVAAGIDRIAIALTVISVTGVIVALFAVASLAISVFTMRSVNRVLGTLERQMDRLAPRLEPLIEKATRLADDSRGITDIVRRTVNDLMDTVADLNDSLKHGGQEARVRVREFAAVLDVVKEEAEELLLDGAATARGIHTASELLRRPAAATRGAQAAEAEPEDGGQA